MSFKTRSKTNLVELLKVNGDLPKSSWLTPGADNLIKYSLSLKEVSDHLMYGVNAIAHEAGTSFDEIWTRVLAYKIDSHKNSVNSFDFSLRGWFEKSEIS